MIRTALIVLSSLAVVSLSDSAMAGQSRHSRGRSRKTHQKANRASKQLFAAASRLYKQGKLAEAIEKFQQVYDRTKNPKVLANIAICHAESNDPVAAVTYWRRALRQAPPKLLERMRAAKPKVVADAEQKVGDLTVVGPEPTAAIQIDGRQSGDGNVTVLLAAGPHEVLLSKEGRHPVRRTISVEGGHAQTWKVETWPKPPVQRRVTKTKHGHHRLFGRIPGYYFLAAAAVTVAAGATLVGLGVKTNQLEDDYHANPSASSRDQGLRYRMATNAMVGILTVSAVTSVVVGVFTDWKGLGRLFGRSEKNGTAFITPLAGPRTAGISISGTY